VEVDRNGGVSSILNLKDGKVMRAKFRKQERQLQVKMRSHNEKIDFSTRFCLNAFKKTSSDSSLL
jgi:hypothetical protein